MALDHGWFLGTYLCSFLGSVISKMEIPHGLNENCLLNDNKESRCYTVHTRTERRHGLGAEMVTESCHLEQTKFACWLWRIAYCIASIWQCGLQVINIHQVARGFLWPSGCPCRPCMQFDRLQVQKMWCALHCGLFWKETIPGGTKCWKALTK